jgi:Cupin-like domain
MPLSADPSSMFLWLGKDTLTPVHHDTTMNLMCQIMGAKQVRLVAPEHWRLIKHRSGVHSWLNWIEDGVFTNIVWGNNFHTRFQPIG